MSIRYLLFPLLFFCLALQADGQTPNRQVAITIVNEQVRSVALREAMLVAINRHQEADRWSGVNDRQIFGISVVPFTDSDARNGDVRLLRTTARLIAAKEMLFANVLLDKYAKTGLTDAGSLRTAVAGVNETFSLQGRVTYDMDATFITGNLIVGIVVANRNRVMAIMTEQVRVNAVRSAYCEVVHRQAKCLIADNKFEEALSRLLELRQAGLFGREQLFDVFHCFVGLDRPLDAERIIDSLLVGHTEDVELFRRLVSITTAGEHNDFRSLTLKLQTEIDRLAPQELTAEQVFEQLLNEFSGASRIQ